MIIDCHTHIGRNNHINFSVDQLLLSMDKSGIEKSLVFAGVLNNVPNLYLMSQIHNHQDRLHGVAAWHPEADSSDWDALVDLVEGNHIAAVKFYLGYDYWYPTDQEIYKVLSLLEKNNVTAIFHCGDCLNSVKSAKLKYAHPLGIDEVAVDFPDQKIVIAHMGYPWHRDSAEVVYKNKNVFVDISGFVYGGFGIKNEQSFRKVIDEFVEVAGGTNQMLFGTDSPISHQDDYVLVASKILPESIFFENPKKAFNL